MVWRESVKRIGQHFEVFERFRVRKWSGKEGRCEDVYSVTMDHLRGLDEDPAIAGVFWCCSDRGHVWEVNRSKADFGSEVKIVVSGISIRKGVTLSE